MITYLLGVAVKSVFLAVVALVRTLFGSAWTTLSSKVAAVLELDGVSVGLGIYNTFVGIDFTAWGLGLAVTIIITVRLIRLVLGIFSKAG